MAWGQLLAHDLDHAKPAPVKRSYRTGSVTERNIRSNIGFILGMGEEGGGGQFTTLSVQNVFLLKNLKMP